MDDPRLGRALDRVVERDKQLAEAVTLLSLHEWDSLHIIHGPNYALSPHYERCCPDCGQTQAQGHENLCIRAAFLTAHKEKREYPMPPALEENVTHGMKMSIHIDSDCPPTHG